MKQLVNHEDSRKHRDNLAQIENQLSSTTIQDRQPTTEDNDSQQFPDLYEITTERVRTEEGMTSTENPLFGNGMVSSISSVSLPADEVLKTLETLEAREFEEDFYIEAPKNKEGGEEIGNLDSLLYMKIRELKSRGNTLPVKETLERLVKNPNYSKFDEDFSVDDTDSLLPCGDASKVILPRGKRFPSFEAAKKLPSFDDLKFPSFEGKGMKRSVTEGNIRAGALKHSISDSLKILKKRTVAESGKFRRRFFSRNESSGHDGSDVFAES